MQADTVKTAIKKWTDTLEKKKNTCIISNVNMQNLNPKLPDISDRNKQCN